MSKFDEMLRYIVEGTKKNSAMVSMMYDKSLQIIEYDFDEIYANFAEQIGKESLTREEKQMAILNHVLEQGKQSE